MRITYFSSRIGGRVIPLLVTTSLYVICLVFVIVAWSLFSEFMVQFQTPITPIFYRYYFIWSFLFALGIGFFSAAQLKKVLDRGRSLIFLAVSFLIIIYSQWSSSPRVTFLRHLYSISEGMDKQDVYKRMEPFMKQNQKFYPLDTLKSKEHTSNMHLQRTGERLFFQHSDPSYNADCGEVIFGNGIVVKVNFYPD